METKEFDLRLRKSRWKAKAAQRSSENEAGRDDVVR
jgi:hypothetical protein